MTVSQYFEDDHWKCVLGCHCSNPCTSWPGSPFPDTTYRQLHLLSAEREPATKHAELTAAAIPHRRPRVKAFFPQRRSAPSEFSALSRAALALMPRGRGVGPT